jgi:hypothetical protein
MRAAGVRSPRFAFPTCRGRALLASLRLVTTPIRIPVVVAVAVILAGCGGSAPPTVVPAAPAAPPPVVMGAPDTVGATLGSPNALYTYRFKMTSSGSGFTYRDRELSFYFRPTPTALFFRVENLQGRPVWIDWDRSQFQDAHGRMAKVAHSTTRYRDRFNTQAQTQVPPQQTISDYVFSMDDLLDAGAGVNDDNQPHRPILPEDQSAPSFTGRTFGVDLEMLIEDKPRTYTFRFEVASVIPR